MISLQAYQGSRPEFVINHEIWEVAPNHPMQDKLLLHRVIRHRTARRAIDKKMVLGCIPRCVANDALRERL
jgi:hypothetical protein